MTLKRYETTVHGNATTLLLSDEEAKRLGLLDAPAGKSAPTNKAAKPAANKTRAPRAPRSKKPAAAKPAPAAETPAAAPAAPETPAAE